MSESEHYGVDYSIAEIASYLENVRRLIRHKRYSIAMNQKRVENKRFIAKHMLTPMKIKEMLLSLETNDFCYVLDNTNPGFEHERLYVFAKDWKFEEIQDNVENVQIYIKFNVLYQGDHEQLVVISFHETDRPMKRLFD
jgi:hypothetical protein